VKSRRFEERGTRKKRKTVNGWEWPDSSAVRWLKSFSPPEAGKPSTFRLQSSTQTPRQRTTGADDMGVFHCPFGAAFQDDDGCVDCGLCYAKTKEDMVAASHRVRGLIRARTDNNKPTQKIAIAGKGGVGKSTVVTLMANALQDEGYTVLIVDTDESNPGLYRLLGFAKPPRPLVAESDRLAREEAAADSGWPAKAPYSIQEIPAPFVLEDGRLRFITMGKITDPFQGCACSMVDVIRDLVGNLVLSDESKEAVLVDMEAGVESFGRGVERSVDTVLIVVEPSYESIALAEKAKYMADGIGLKRVRAILNKMPSDQIASKVMEELSRKGIEPLGSIFFDPAISDSGLEGTALRASRAGEDVKQIVRRLIERKCSMSVVRAPLSVVKNRPLNPDLGI